MLKEGYQVSNGSLLILIQTQTPRDRYPVHMLPHNMRIFQQSAGELHKQTVTLQEAMQTKRDFTNDPAAVSETGKHGNHLTN